MLYYSQGNAIVTRDELIDKSYKELPTFYTNLYKGLKPASIEFSTGTLSCDNVHRKMLSAAEEGMAPFQQIGPGKPLTIQIREVYTGKYPSTLFHKAKDMLVTTATKSIGTFDAKPRAINFLQQQIAPGSRLYHPRATEQGTPIVFYTPALVDKSLTLDLEMVFDKWDQDIFDQIGQGFVSASSIPIFLPYSFYLLAAGTILKLAGQTGEALFDGKPDFAVSEPLDILWPGAEPAQPGFLMLTQHDVDAVDPAFRKDHEVDRNGKLVNNSGEEYTGEIPYVIISLDGTKNDEFSSWTSTAASAALLGRFLHINNGQSRQIDVLLDAMKIYNDLDFRRKVDRFDERISKETDSHIKGKLVDERNAIAKNILEDLLRPAQIKLDVS